MFRAILSELSWRHCNHITCCVRWLYWLWGSFF